MAEGEKKIRPEVMMIALLDEVAKRLRSLESMQKEENPEGIVEPIEDVLIMATRRQIKPPKGKWFSISLINDGPNDVFAIVNTEKSLDEHRIVVGETYNVDMRHGLIGDVLLWCNPGLTSHIRLVGTR